MSVSTLDDAAWSGPWREISCTAKVLSAAILLTAALALPPWPGAAVVGLTGVVLLLVGARVPVLTLAVALSLPIVSIVTGAATIALVSAGAASWSIGPVGWTLESLTTGARVVVRGLAGTVAIYVLALTTPLVDVVSWARRLGIPGPLLDVADAMYRLLFVTMAAAVALVNAFTRRLGTTPGGRRRWNNRGLLLSAIGMRSLARATRLEQGLSLRGDLDSLRTLTHATRAGWQLPLACVVATCAAGALSWGQAWF